MKLLHTSDWHLGRSLHYRRRYTEFEQFLQWILQTLQQQQVDVLVIAGDVFDTTAPSHRAQTLYYQFLHQVAVSSCRHVVITAGNHDSPSFLNAPKALLRALNVQVIGNVPESLEEEVLELKNTSGETELIVCAVPYLRDRELRSAEAGETLEDKERKLLAGIRQHYQAVAEYAENLRSRAGADVPILATGHLFTAGGKTQEGDGVRELYVGSLAHVTAGIFPENLDYVALGHLHVPQLVGGKSHIRYSGSPLPMGFGEAKQQKSVALVTFTGRQPSVELLPVPTFQRLASIRGDWQAIEPQLQALISSQESVWIEVIYQSNELLPNLRERIDDLLAGSAIEVLRVRDNRVIQRVMQQAQVEETLDDLSEQEVFERVLTAHQIAEEQKPALRASYQQVLNNLYEQDQQAG